MGQTCSKLACPSFAAWPQVAAFTGLRHRKLDALRWEQIAFHGEREKEPSQAIRIICCPERPVPGASVPEIGLSIMSDTIDRLDGPSVRFARSATRHRISKDHIHHVIANHRVRFEEPPPETDSARARSMRIVYLGDDDRGRALEVMAVEGKRGELLVIHVMELRDRYRKRYEDQK